MAPEVVARLQEYTKSVDMWAVGIIMHEILTCGKHPFYRPKTDTVASVKEKITDLRRVDPVEKFSWIAKNLFEKLTQIQSHMRYTAADALVHPWVTRMKVNRVPQNLSD